MVLVWQLLHSVVALGMCGGVTSAWAPEVPWPVYEPLWQLLHGVPLTALWFIV